MTATDHPVNFVAPRAAELVTRVSQFSVCQWFLVTGIIIAAITTCSAICNLLLSPLRGVPGPLAWRISSVPWAYHAARGALPMKLLALHEAYGPVVRTRPAELSFSSAQAWRDIYGHRSKAAAGRPFHPELPKHVHWYKTAEEDPDGIGTAPRERHAVIRSTLLPGFSERSMQAQQPTFLRFVDQLMDKFRERASSSPPGPASSKSPPVNVVAWFNYVTFDVVSELTYGESFQCMHRNTYHEVPRQIFNLTSEQGLLRACKTVLGSGSGILRALRWYFIPTDRRFRSDGAKRLANRLGMGHEREHDLIAGLVEKQKRDNALSFGELAATVDSLILAGSETTATVLTAVTYYLLKDPKAYARVVAEVRQRFASEDEISLSTVSRLSYMLACLKEALRLYPPAAGGLPRIVPAGGDIIDGVAVPAGTVVSVTQLAANRSSSNWAEPHSFRPERWLKSPGFENDKLDAMQPFSVGPRNCIGKNLAYSEMRLILAKTLYNFDLELAPESRDWLVGQRAYVIWQKPPLYVYLTSVTNGAK